MSLFPSIPTFSGNTDEWQEFENIFKSVVSRHSQLSDVERFMFLNRFLDGEALALVSHLPLTAANYYRAWVILQARYGNRRDLAQFYIDVILATQLAVGDEHLPPITEFIEFLHDQLRTVEINSNYSGTPNSFTRPSQQQESNSLTSPCSEVLSIVSDRPAVLNCPLCKSNHPILRCRDFTGKSPNERFTIAKNLRLCFKCLEQDHSVSQCPSKGKRCNRCKTRPHHTMLHIDRVTTPLIPTSNVRVNPFLSFLTVRSRLQMAIRLSTVFILTFCLVMGVCLWYHNLNF